MNIKVHINNNKYILTPLNEDGSLTIDATSVEQIFANANTAIMSIARSPQVVMDEILVEINERNE